MPETKDVATKPVTLNSLLSEPIYKRRFEEIMGQRAPAFISSILSLYSANQQLRDADPQSILQAAVVAATLNLPINPNLGLAYIIPYGKVAQFQMGYKGFVKLALNTGKYKTIHATEVYKDEIAKWNPLTAEFEATPFETWKMREASEGKLDSIVGYLSFFKLINGYEKYWYWTAAQVRAHGQKFSKSFSNPNGRWQQDFKAMALKTVLKLNLSKWGDLSIEMQKALEVDQAVIETTGEITYPDRAEDAPVPSKPTGAEKLLNEDQIKLLYARIDKSGIERDEVKLYVRTTYKKDHFKELTVEELSKVIQWLEQDPNSKP